MSKFEKRPQKIRQNPKHVRSDEVVNILLRLGFNMRQGSTPHAIFVLGTHRITVPKPHKSPFVKEVYIQDLLSLLEALDIDDEEE